MPENQPNKMQLRFREVRTELGKNQVEFAKLTNLKQSHISAIERGVKNITAGILLGLEDTIGVNRKWLETGEGSMFNSVVSEPLAQYGKSLPETGRNYPIESNALLIGEAAVPGEESKLTPLGNNKYGLTVHLVPVKAYAGYLDNFGDPEYYDTLDKHTVTIVGNHHGYYLAFAVKGNSMENWTSEEMARASIPENYIVTCRDLPKHHWHNKLHLHRWEFYVIVHQEGIIVKQVIEHNVQEGWIICHSLNPDKKLYPDLKIYFSDCLQILNVVQKGVAL